MINKVSFIPHSEIDDKTLHEIVLLKMQHWQYPVDAQMRWIKENLSAEDTHVCIQAPDNQIVAYLNLVGVHVSGDQQEWDMQGIGNVCVDKAYLGKGLGRIIMEEVNKFLVDTSNVGLLLCRKELEGFYLKSGWFPFYGVVTLADQPYQNLVFSSSSLPGDNLKIEKNF